MNKNSQRNNFKYRSKLIIKATESELIFKKYLEENKIKFIFQKGFLLPFHRIVDFYIPGKKIIIEIDGGYHKNPAERMKDRFKDKRFLEARGMNTIRITNEQVFDNSFNEVIHKYLFALRYVL